MGDSMNLLRTQNFLFCCNLRCGTLTILWTFTLLLFYSLLVVSAFEVNDNDVPALLFFIIIVLFVGEVIAVLTLIYFPAPNKTYSPDSKTAKYLKYFAWYFGFLTVILLVVYFCLTVYVATDRKRSVPALIPFAVIAFLLTASLIHFMAVTYSFYLSVLSNENLDEIRKDVNVRTCDKNWAAMSTNNCLQSSEVPVSKLCVKEPVAGSSFNKPKIVEIL